MAIAKTEFLWYKRKDIIKESDPILLKEWADKGFISLDDPAEKHPELDLNKDGKVDAQDVKIAKEVSSNINKALKPAKSKKK